MAIAVSGQWTRLRTLGRGASGAVVSLAADGSSGELFAVKSVVAADAALLSREQGIMSSLCSPDVVRCLGGAHRDDGSYHLFLEFVTGGSLADEVARNGGRLEERAIRAYAADVLRGLAYIHSKSLVHGDIKSRNIVIGMDGRAKIADFGCARMAGSDQQIGGTPAFMAPEVARGEDQGPAADVWALGCTVVEMATGRAPWSGIDNVLAAVHQIGYTDAVPEVPMWLSPEAKDFLAMCFARNARDRRTAAELLEHPFLALRAGETKARRWLSPKSALDAAFRESQSDDEGEEEVQEDQEISRNASERIKSMACSVSALTDWESDDGWIHLFSGEQCDEACDSPATKQPADLASRAPGKVFGSAAMPAEDIAVVGGLSSDEQLDAEEGPPFGGYILADDHSTDRENKVCPKSDRDILPCNRIDAIEKFRFPHKMLSRSDKLSSQRSFTTYTWVSLAYPKATIASKFVFTHLHLHPGHCTSSPPYRNRSGHVHLIFHVTFSSSPHPPPPPHLRRRHSPSSTSSCSGTPPAAYRTGSGMPDHAAIPRPPITPAAGSTEAMNLRSKTASNPMPHTGLLQIDRLFEGDRCGAWDWRPPLFLTSPSI